MNQPNDNHREITMSDRIILTLEISLICLTVGVNIFIFVHVMPMVMDVEYNMFEKDLVMVMMFFVPIPSGFFIYALSKSMLLERKESAHKKEVNEN